MAEFVYIATTQGPVRIQSIIEEDPDINSVICLDGMPEPLAISDRYHDFVKKGTGIIHKRFGHGSYRVDVEKRIDQGTSWQLGLFVAHELHEQQKLTNTLPQPSDTIFFVTGSIKSNGDITAVEKVPEKIEIAATQLKDWLSMGCNVQIIVAESQHGIPNEKELTALGIHHDQLIIHMITKTKALAPILGIDKQEQNQATNKQSQTAQWLMPAIIIVLLGAGTAVAITKDINLHTINLLAQHTLERFTSHSQRTTKEPEHSQKVKVKTKVHIGSMPQTIVNDQQSVVDKPTITLRAKLNNHKACQQSHTQTIPLLNTSQFTATKIADLCELEWQLPKSHSPIAFSLDKLRLIPMLDLQTAWILPMPTTKAKVHHYAVIVVETSQKKALSQQLDKQLLRWELQDITVNQQTLNQWLRSQSHTAHIYFHQLTSD